MNAKSLKLGYLIAWITSLLTILTFSIAICTPPISGPYCQANCIEYPYLDIISRFPRDYLWMFPAIITTLLYIALVALVYENAGIDKKIWGLLGLSFSIVSGIMLIVDYFIQVSVIQSSLLKGETYGIPLLTQYNPHGIFIALEEIGYLIMSLSFFFLFPVFSWKNKQERAIRLIFLSCFPLNIVALLLVTITLGLQREYLFEIIVISVSWLVLISGGFLSGRLYRKKYLEVTIAQHVK